MVGTLALAALAGDGYIAGEITLIYKTNIFRRVVPNVDAASV